MGVIMNTERINCWEDRKCTVFEKSPAYPNQGRICFSVNGTLCRGEVQGGYFDKVNACKEKCDFLKKIDPDNA